jgi:hypothetical protein
MDLYIWQTPDGKLHGGEVPPNAITVKFQLWQFCVTLVNNKPVFTPEAANRPAKIPTGR